MTAAADAALATLVAEPHHDGSDGYVLERPEAPGGEAVVRLRVPRGLEPEQVVLRYVRDGEPRAAVAVVDEETPTETWWRASFPVHAPAVRYRWLVSGGGAGWTWVNGAGAFAHDVADADDHVLALDSGGPEWHLRGAVYQVFPDRFASAGLDVPAPDWAVRRGWDELPTGRGPDTPRELFGGDLAGVEAHLDHVRDLGASVLYLTPIFPAFSTHRYDATTFRHVDPLLGGDEALVSLVRAAHAAGIRVVGDLTLNHVGAGHEWFRRAADEPESAEREFFFFDDSLPGGYESWLGVKSLPKLDHRSAELRRRLHDVVRRWLQQPFALDGWRIDVANMAGRYGAIDLNRAVAHGARLALEAARPDALLVAEHGHDYRADLGGGGWHGVMNYSGFLRPVWTWLRRDDPAPEQQRAFWGTPVGVPQLPGGAAVRAMRTFAAGVPWQALLHSWNLVDSHDTARFRTVAGSRERQLAGVGLQCTLPGVPMLFAGSELGLEGEWGEDARRTMPWSRPESWDRPLLEETRRLVALRRSSDALARGGCRFVHVDDDAIAYLRETRAERLLCLAARAPHAPLHVPLRALGAGGLETLYGAPAALAGGAALLPADGPSFHVWRLIDG